MSTVYERMIDAVAFKNEALWAGFTKVQIHTAGITAEPCGLSVAMGNGYRLFEDTWSRGDVHMSTQKWCVAGQAMREASDFEWFTSKHIDHLGLTDKQLFFLNWAVDWANKIQPLWEATEFTDVYEFIQDLKEHCTPVYQRPGSATKSAMKK